MKTLLWLDDYRDPNKDDWMNFSPIGKDCLVVWVKSYEEFVDWIKTYELPDAICFDHDLGDFPENEKTGCDCAKWLVKYCYEKGKPLPLFNIQSANLVGKANIQQLLERYNRAYGA